MMRAGSILAFLAIFFAAHACADGVRHHGHGRISGLGADWIGPAQFDDDFTYDMSGPEWGYDLPSPAPETGYAPVAAPPSVTSMYFCAASDAFYPYVPGCPSGWKTVAVNSQVGFNMGLAAYRKKDFATALSEWRPLAIFGNARAQFTLGTMYETGSGVTRNDREAVKWFRFAADQGRADAQNNLGVMYETGHGVPQNYSLAVKWYRRAAEQGYAKAQFNLAQMYADGLGVPQDAKQAAAWYRLAADQGDVDAKSILDQIDANEPAAHPD
jgi:TPR repeat protein